MSFRKIINAKCKECIYDPMSSGTWRQQVAQCTSKTCPIYPVRPMPYVGKGKDVNAPESSELIQIDVITE